MLFQTPERMTLKKISKNERKKKTREKETFSFGDGNPEPSVSLKTNVDESEPIRPRAGAL